VSIGDTCSNCALKSRFCCSRKARKLADAVVDVVLLLVVVLIVLLDVCDTDCVMDRVLVGEVEFEATLDTNEISGSSSTLAVFVVEWVFKNRSNRLLGEDDSSPPVDFDDFDVVVRVSCDDD